VNNLYIDRAWLVSRRAQRVYAACAWVTAGFAVVTAAYTLGEMLDKPISFTALPAWDLIIFVGVLAFATLEVGMAYFWWNFDRSGGFTKLLGLLLALPPIGTVLYYALCYRKGVAAESGALATSAGK
jgi:hypothetical protein